MKKILLILFIALTTILNVNAETLTANGFSTDGTSVYDYSNFLPRYIYGNSNSYSDDFFIPLLESQNIEQFRTIKLQICGPQNLKVEIRNYLNGKIQNIDTLNTTSRCSIYSTNDSYWSIIYIDQNAWWRFIQTSYIYAVDLYIRIYGNVSWNWTATINNVYYSTENTYTDDLLMVQQGKSTEVIESQNNTIINQNNEIIDNIEDLNDNINDDTLPSTSDWLDDWTDLLLENNAVNQILYIPVNILNKIKGALTGQCSDVSIPFGLTGGNETLTFNCWKVTDYVGSTVGDLITGFVGFYLIYYFALFLWKFYDDFTSMKDTLSLILGNDNALIVRGDNNG